ncbi:hypothetical protein FIBSPDRAFT_747929, partial [Athelia psychrophila]
SVFPSAISTFYVPSDQSGINRMIRHRIRATLHWHNGPARYDTVFIKKDEELGMRGMHVAQTKLFFSFVHEGVCYPCALVHWFIPFGEEPCEETGLWIVACDEHGDGTWVASVVHLDSIIRGSHLIGHYRHSFIP